MCNVNINDWLRLEITNAHNLVARGNTSGGLPSGTQIISKSINTKMTTFNVMVDLKPIVYIA